MDLDYIVREIDIFLEELKQPVSEDESSNGWDREYKDQAISMMVEVRDALVARSVLPRGSIVKTMDAWGVNGPLFDEACKISHHINIVNRQI